MHGVWNIIAFGLVVVFSTQRKVLGEMMNNGKLPLGSKSLFRRWEDGTFILYLISF